MAKKKDGVKIKLGYKDRFKIADLFPRESNILTLIIVESISKKIAFSAAEQKCFEPTPEGNVKWGKNKNVDIYFTKAEIELLKTQISLLDSKKKLTQEMLSTILKIRDCNV